MKLHTGAMCDICARFMVVENERDEVGAQYLELERKCDPFPSNLTIPT